MSKWKDAGHLIRPAIVFLVGLGVFGVLRQALVPATFGQYGHYRAAVLEEIRKLPVRHAGQQVCAGCHPDVVEKRAAGKHRGVTCEACHGPAAAHAADPAAKKPVKPVATPLCRRCHEADTAKPAGFKQVDTAKHSQGMTCDSCHQAHRPAL